MDELLHIHVDWSMGGGVVWLAIWACVMLAFFVLASLQGPKDNV